MATVPALWSGYGARWMRPNREISWVRIGTDPRWLQLFVTNPETAVVPIRVSPLDAPGPDAWWGAWDVAKGQWTFVAPSRQALGIHFPAALSVYAAEGSYVFTPVQIEEATVPSLL